MLGTPSIPVNKTGPPRRRIAHLCAEPRARMEVWLSKPSKMGHDRGATIAIKTRACHPRPFHGSTSTVAHHNHGSRTSGFGTLRAAGTSTMAGERPLKPGRLRSWKSEGPSLPSTGHAPDPGVLAHCPASGRGVESSASSPSREELGGLCFLQSRCTPPGRGEADVRTRSRVGGSAMQPGTFRFGQAAASGEPVRSRPGSALRPVFIPPLPRVFPSSRRLGRNRALA